MSDVLSRVNWNIAANDILVTIAVGSHLFPFRTEKLSPPAPMILQFLWESRGRLFKESYRNVTLLFFICYFGGRFCCCGSNLNCSHTSVCCAFIFSHAAKSPHQNNKYVQCFIFYTRFTQAARLYASTIPAAFLFALCKIYDTLCTNSYVLDELYVAVVFD